MQYLYTLSNCASCEEAKKILGGEPYQEVLLDNPFVQLGMQAHLGKLISPTLIKEDGLCYFLAQFGDQKQFVRILGN